MSKPKGSVKIVNSKKLPADFSLPVPREDRELDRERSPLKAAREETRAERKSSRKSKNPFKPFFNYIQQAEQCTWQIKDLPDLNHELMLPKPLEVRPLQAHQFITLGTIKNARRTGPVRKVLHVPSFNLLVIKEQPYLSKSRLLELKQWVSSSWKLLDSYDPFLSLPTSPFWNLPEGSVSVVCEHVQGGSLKDVLRFCISLPEKAIRQLVIEILQAYSVIVKERVKYDCLSPSQVLFTGEGRVKLSLGLCRKVGAGADPEDPLWDLSYSSGEDFMSSQVFKIGLVALLSATGSFDIMDHFETLIKRTAAVIASGAPRAPEQCCILHSHTSILGTLSGPSKRQGLSALQLLAPFSSQFQDFLCKCLKVHPEDRLKVEGLLKHPFITKVVNSRKPNLKEMLRMCHGGQMPVQLKQVAKMRLHKFLESLRIALGELRRDELAQVLSKCIVCSPTIRGIASEFGLSQSSAVLKIRELRGSW